jgi:hypothetical protein
MDKRAAHLATLGLAPDASWDEVTQAYKDLMRVWHPDRFQGDERLRKKAEVQAQRINEAMSELRKMGKEPTKPLTTQTSSTTKAAQASSSTRRSEQSTSEQRAGNSSHEQSTHTGSFLIAPLYVRQRFGTSIFRILAASAVFYVAFGALGNPSASTSQEAAALAFAFLALDFGVRNAAIMLLPKPVVAIERSGLFFLKTGRLGWADIESAWPVMTPRYHQLSLVLSQHYLSKRSFIIRTLLRFRRWAKTPHIVIPFNGLTADPVSVINAMRLRQIHHDVAIEEPCDRPTGWLVATFIVGVICASVAFARCLLGLTLTPVEYIPYFILFGVCRGSGVTLRVYRG